LDALGTGRYHEVLETHTEALRRAFAAGHEVRIEGDALFMVFATAQDALAAAAAGQRALASAAFPHGAVVRVRMGMHTGEGTPASERAGADYVGIDVHRAARIAAVAHGGQVLISGATRMLAGSDLPAGVQLRDLGAHRLKDLAQPERIFQLVIDGCPSEFPALRTLDRTPNNLPQQITTFIGREKEIRDGLRLLDRTRVLTLTGPGGTGKTRLSLQLAAEVGDQFPDGAFWVPLAPISDPELVPSTIAHSLGVQVSGNELPVDRVIEHLRDKTLLLVLDNFEQILAAAPTVSSLLAAAPGVKIVTSSRAPLRIAGEQELAVPPLDLPDPERLPSLEVLAQSDAVRLFIERARAVKPDFMVTAENASAVAEIVFRLDGLPLAIELAAARVKLLTPQAMLPRLREGLDLLASAGRDRTDRQRTLRGAIAWSYDLLDDGMQRLFARCAVFVAGAQLDQLEAVCGPSGDIGREVLEGVGELVDQSLLRQSEVAGEPRFRMLVTIRDYALERLAERGEERALRAAHLAAYLVLAERARPELQGKDQKRWLDRVELEHDNLRAALELAISDGQADEAARLVYALWRFWQSRGHLREGRGWAERAVALPGASRELRLRALEALGGLVYWMGDPAMLGHYGAALALAREMGDKKEIALAAYNLSFAYTIPGNDMAHGRPLLEEALALFRELGDGAAIGRASFALTNVLSAGGGHTREDLQLARRTIQEALEHHRTLSNQFDLAWDLHMAGLVDLKLGDLDGARRAWVEAIGLFEAAGDISGIVLMLSDFSELARAAGDIERHDVLVGAWAALARKTGIGLTAVFGRTEDRAQPETIPAERQPAVKRGLDLKLAEAVAYALGTEPARSA
ncbi:MAG TPA: NB-ARC domain-containing protein, partial [Candidatus Limnocylindria bacterium]|nr:NB-ARC domain-containing protein [Candidatus Limnocylindria bacterium]